MGKKRKLDDFSYIPTIGVRLDFKRLLNDFIRLNTVRYEEFSRLWREKKMEYLYLGRCTDREAREFIEEIILIAEEYFLPPYQFQVRVGGLYLLYALYEIQPVVPKVKIRLTLPQWKHTASFELQASQQKHLDVVYVFHRLYQEKAFLFCHCPFEHNPYSSMNDSLDKEEDLADNMKEESTSITELCNFESIEKLSFFQEKYQQSKISLAGPTATKPDKSLDVLCGTLTDDIVGLLQSYKQKVQEILKNEPKTVTVVKQTEQTIREKREHLRLTAFSSLSAPKRPYHSIVTETGTKDSEIKLPPMQSTESEDKLDIDISESDKGSDEDYVPSKYVKAGSKGKIRKFTRRNSDATETANILKNQDKDLNLHKSVLQQNSNMVSSISSESEPDKGTMKEMSIQVHLPRYGKNTNSSNIASTKKVQSKSDEPTFKKVCISSNEILVLPPEHLVDKLRTQKDTILVNGRTKRIRKKSAQRDHVKNQPTLSDDFTNQNKSLPPSVVKNTEQNRATDTNESRMVVKMFSKRPEKLRPGKILILDSETQEAKQFFPSPVIKNEDTDIMCGKILKKTENLKKNVHNEALLKLKQRCLSALNEEKSEGKKKQTRIFTPDSSLIDDDTVIQELKPPNESIIQECRQLNKVSKYLMSPKISVSNARQSCRISDISLTNCVDTNTGGNLKVIQKESSEKCDKNKKQVSKTKFIPFKDVKYI
ncbi:Small nuclear RNA activating complex, polypeptide 1, 43kDa [Bulinus truncatus]|nr:Small nuclear RNA activating complex, polypeptide 1, 43kDa [Bulinus truncatus]